MYISRFVGFVLGVTAFAVAAGAAEDWNEMVEEMSADLAATHKTWEHRFEHAVPSLPKGSAKDKNTYQKAVEKQRAAALVNFEKLLPEADTKSRRLKIYDKLLEYRGGAKRLEIARVIRADPDSGKALLRRALDVLVDANLFAPNCWNPCYSARYEKTLPETDVRAMEDAFLSDVRQILADEPNNTRRWLDLAEALMSRKDYAEAEKAYRRAEQSEQALFGIADALFGQGRRDEAKKVLEELHAKWPRTVGRVYSPSTRYADLARWALDYLDGTTLAKLDLPRASAFRAFPEAQESDYAETFAAAPAFAVRTTGIAADDARIRLFEKKMKKRGFAFTADAPYAVEVVKRPDAPVDRSEGYSLVTTAKGARIEARDAQGVLWGLVTLIQIADPAKKAVRCAKVRDWPDLAQRGYLGAYWTDCAEFTVMFKMNTVIHQRHPEFLGQFTPLRVFLNESLAHEFRNLGLDLYYGLNWLSMDPQLPMKPPRTTEFRSSVFKHYAAMGAHVYWPLDDVRFPLIPQDLRDFGAGANIDAKHLDKLWKLTVAEYPDFKVVFCPPFYWGPDGKGWRVYPEMQEPYLKSIARDLDPAVDVIWTGPRVKGYKKEKHKVKWFSDLIGRKPSVFQNGTGPHNLLSYVVDRTDWNRWWHYDGFYGDIAMYLKNSATPSECPQITTLADCLWNDAKYNPERAVREGVAMLMGAGVFEALDEGLAALSYFDKYKYGQTRDPKKNNALDPALEKESEKDLIAKWKQGAAAWEKAKKLAPAECALYGRYADGVDYAKCVVDAYVKEVGDTRREKARRVADLELEEPDENVMEVEE